MIEQRRAAQLAAARATTQRTTQANAQDIERQRQYQLMMEQQRAAAAKQAEDLVPELRALMKTNPRQTIDRLLNKGDMQKLLQAGRYDDVEELAVAAIIAAARDTWQVEQLQRIRVNAFFGAQKIKEALSASRALFNVAGMGSVQYDIGHIALFMSPAYKYDQTIVHRFRLQQLAAAHTDPQQRKIRMADLGEDVMASIPVDPAPFAQAIKDQQNATDYDTLYSVGNLLLLSGRITEAREVFEKVYQMAPPGELKYATEAIAKVIKAEDAAIGRANAFLTEVRPKE
jgi:hypothetical protein